jgi:hypothetical protein
MVTKMTKEIWKRDCKFFGSVLALSLFWVIVDKLGIFWMVIGICLVILLILVSFLIVLEVDERRSRDSGFLPNAN